MDKLEIVRRWESEFERHRAPPSASAPRMGWLRSVKRRIYFFLLSSYGDASWRPEAGDVPPRDAPGVAELIDHATECGKPPKTVGRIQKTLKAIHNARDNPCPPGPLASGLGREDWIAVATLRKELSIRWYLWMLWRLGIQYDCTWSRKAVIVSVRRCEYDQARCLLEEMPGGEEFARHRDTVIEHKLFGVRLWNSSRSLFGHTYALWPRLALPAAIVRPLAILSFALPIGGMALGVSVEICLGANNGLGATLGFVFGVVLFLVARGWLEANRRR
jgi:hypothetical protein